MAGRLRSSLTPFQASRDGVPGSTTRPGAAAGGAAAGAGAGERNRSRYGANVAAGMLSRAVPAGSDTAPHDSKRSGWPASRSATVARTRSSSGSPCTEPVRSPQVDVTRPVRRTRACGTPGPSISPMPTARRWRTVPGVPGGNEARRMSSVNTCPTTGTGNLTTPPVTGTGGDDPDSLRSRTSVGRRTRSRNGAMRSSCTATRPDAVQRSHAVRPSSHEPIHARGVRSKALEARNAGRPSKRPDESNRPFTPTSVSMLESGASAATVPQALGSHVRAAGGENTRSRPGSPSIRSRTSTAPAVPRRGSRRNGSSPVVRSNRYVRPTRESSRPASARSARTGGRSASLTLTPGMRSSRIPPGPVGTPGGCTTDAIRTRSALTRCNPTSSRLTPACTANRRPLTSTAVTRPRRSEYGSSSIVPTSRGASKPTSSQWRDSSSARSACQCVRVSPSKAANGRRSGNCENAGENGERR